MIVSLILYCLLGAALGAAGVGVTDKPWQFCCIMALVVFIDLHSKFGRG